MHRGFKFRLYPTADQEACLRQIVGVAGVYRIFTDAGRSYVGSAHKLTGRWKHHYSHLIRGRHHSKKFQAAWDKHGPDAFWVEVLEVVGDPADLLAREQHWIDTFSAAGRRGLNILPTAGSPRGRTLSPETRAKISQAHKGRKHTPEHRENNRRARTGKRLPPESYAAGAEKRRGMKRSPEATAKATAANRGQKRSAEAKARMSAWQKDKPITERMLAAYAKISAANRGRRMSEETRARMRVAALEREARKRERRSTAWLDVEGRHLGRPVEASTLAA